MRKYAGIHLQCPCFVRHPCRFVDRNEVERDGVAQRLALILELFILLWKFLADLAHYAVVHRNQQAGKRRVEGRVGGGWSTERRGIS